MLSFMTSHRGASGRIGVMDRRMNMNMSCRATGKRQVTAPEAWNVYQPPEWPQGKEIRQRREAIHQ